MWECEWRALKETDADVAAFVARFDLKDPLNPRDAFYGGRMNAIKLYHHVGDQEEIRYDDFTSLYPWVNKYGRYPVGHPTFLYKPGTTNLSPYGASPKRSVPSRTTIPSSEQTNFPLCRT